MNIDWSKNIDKDEDLEKQSVQETSQKKSALAEAAERAIPMSLSHQIPRGDLENHELQNQQEYLRKDQQII